MPSHPNKKQAQRTKGNTKPSSSSQAAQLLASNSGGTPAFIGFGSSSSPAFVPASELFDDYDNALDSDFRLVLCKFSKKDTTTKIKALNEFTDLCKNKDEEILKCVLPYWPKIYNKLSLDVDHKVRELTQHGMSALLERVHRNIAPHLKTLMGCWILAQCDTYPTVSSAAMTSFQTAFPNAKQSDAINFCKKEIIEYLTDNLVNQTAINLSDPKITSSEDMENKYTRVMTASLLGLRRLLLALPDDQLIPLDQELIKLFENNKFWKHAKSNNSLLRSGMFSFIASVCQTRKELAASYSNKISPLVLHSVDETDPVICSALWEAVLSLVSSIQECWSHINVPKAFWPKLRGLLDKGFQGNASLICPNLMPFVGKIPCDILGAEYEFYKQFLSYFKQGIGQESLQNVPSECSAAVKSFSECSLYICKQLLTDSDHHKFVSSILLDQVLPIVEASLIEERAALSKSTLYSNVRLLLVNLEEAEVSTKSEQDVLSPFWNTFSQFVKNSVENSNQDYVIDRTISLCKSFTNKQEPQRVKSAVKFLVDDKSYNVISHTEKHTLTKHQKKFLQEITQHAFNLADGTKKSSFLKLFSELLILDLSAESVSRIVHSHDDSVSDHDVVSHFILSVCVPWIFEMQTSENTVHLLDVFVAFVPLLDISEGVEAFETLLNGLAEPSVILLLLKRSYHKETMCTATTNWLRSQGFGDKLLSFTANLCERCLVADVNAENDIQDSWSILSLSLSFSDSKGSLVSDVYVNKVLQTIHQCLVSLQKSTSRNKMETSVRFVAELVHSFYSHLDCLSLAVGEELLLALFNMSLFNADLPYTTLTSVEAAWTKGLGVITEKTGGFIQEGRLIVKMCNSIQDCIATKTESLIQFDCASNTVNRFLTTIVDKLPEKDPSNPVMQSILKSITFLISPQSVPTRILEYACSARDILITRYQQPQDQSSFSKMLMTALHNVAMLNFRKAGCIACTDTVDTAEAGSKSTETWSGDDIDAVVNITLAFSVCKLWLDTDSHLVTKFEDLTSGTSLLGEKLLKIVDKMSDKSKKKLLTSTLSKSEEEGGHYALTLHTVVELFKQDGNVKLDGNSIIDRYLTTGMSEHKVQTLQQAMPFFSQSEWQNLSDILTAQLITCPSENILTVKGGLGLLSLLRVVLHHMDGSNAELQGNIQAALNQVIVWREENGDLLLYDCDLFEQANELFLLNREICRFLKLSVEKIPYHLTGADWDFIMCSAVSWNQNINSSMDVVNKSTLCHQFAVCVYEFIGAVAQCMEEKLKQNRTSFPDNLETEWNEFFSETIYDALLPHFLATAVDWQNKSLAGMEKLYIKSVGKAVSFCPRAHIESHKLPAYFIAEESSSLPENYQTLINHICPLLIGENQDISITAFHILNKIMPDLSQVDKDVSTDNTQESTSKPLPHSMVKVLDSSQAATEIILADINIDECLTLQPNTEEYHYSMTYLLLWQLIITFFKRSAPEMRAKYASYLEERAAVKHLIRSLFCLMPENPIIVEQKSSCSAPTSSSIIVSDETSSKTIKNLAAQLYRNSLETIPALIRQWWKDQDRKTSAYVDRFTSNYVSQTLANSEIQAVQTANIEMENFSVKARQSTREVIAYYKLDEDITMEMVISLPQNYPLGNIEINSERRMAATREQWKKWLLQLNIFLQHQNGSIIDGLRLWKRNIDKRFEGVDDCMVCFCVIHATTYQLPKLQCKTCKKKFHSACLYKWFNTSNNSTCPMCRNLF